MANVVQNLYETCKEVFANGGAGFVPPPADIQRIQLILDNMKPEDVNLAPDMPFFRSIENEKAPPITYMELYACNKFSISIFCLPTSGVIPLHNHPGMTVLCKLLFGSMHIKSYDWVAPIIPGSQNEHVSRPINSQHPRLRLAKVHIDSDFTEGCNASILYPAAGGNMHCFRALTPCAMLDVQGPPYSEPEGRDCTYFYDYPYSRFSGRRTQSNRRRRQAERFGQRREMLSEEDRKGYAWLEEIEKPEPPFTRGTYNGPEIVDD